ncbi:MAG: Taurine dioxygenase [Caulobacter sp.]|nr:Taurine dioxygenase [Caulobacter sp.]
MTTLSDAPPKVKANPSGFGAEITGVDISRPLPAPVLAAVKDAWARHSILWFPDQPLTHDQLEAFTLQFGDFGWDPYVKPMEGRPHILEVRRDPQETASPFGGAWHSDWSFQQSPPAGTLLHAKIIPPMGGDTLYADGYAAWEALDADTQARLKSMKAIHSATRPYGANGLYANEPDGYRAMQIINSSEADKIWTHPIARVHPASGRTALFINPIYTVGIEGMDEAGSEALLTQLFGHMLEQRFIYRHSWAPDMLTLWDNRCALHCATGGYDGHARVLHRTTVAGEIPIAA